MTGFLLIDKPAGLTSHDVVDRVRVLSDERTVGHAGTLDPFATGLLIVGVGRAATKRLSEFLALEKEYLAQARLDGFSSTGDLTGAITPLPAINQPSKTEIENIFKNFLGAQQQIPPMHSAKKIGGEKLYELARRGETIVRQPATITVHELTLIHYDYPQLEFHTRVSSGTYIRTLAEDIGKKLSTGGYLTTLCRTAIGKYHLDDAVELNTLTNENLADFFIII